jgi:ATP-dependent Zn protease
LAILQIHAHQKPLADDVDLGIIAQETFGFSGAHLESLTNEAAVFALREHSQRITQQHLSEAIDKVMLGEKLECKPSQEEMWRVSVHESGHALLAETVNPQSVAQISVRSRGNALGYVRHYPEDDIHLYTQKMLEDQIMISLSGAVAEELILDTRSTGAAGDYQQALHLVEKMLVSGMSPLGVVDVERLDPEQRYDVTRRILSRLEERTKEVLNRNQERLMRIARMLEQEEVLSGEELRVNLENLG